MKVRLTVGKHPLSGYINIDPAPQVLKEMGSEYKIIASDIRNIDNIVENAVCTELLLENVLEHIHIEYMPSVIQHWYSKVRHGGTVIIKGIDVMLVTHKLHNGEINIIDFNKILFGINTHPWNNKSSCITSNGIVEILERLQLQISHIGLDGISFTIIAKRT